MLLLDSLLLSQKQNADLKRRSLRPSNAKNPGDADLDLGVDTDSFAIGVHF